MRLPCAVPPLNVNGHPEIARDSNSENARIVFSIKVLSSDGCCAATLLIHSIERLSGCIMLIYNFVLFCSIKDVLDFDSTASSGSIPKELCLIENTSIYGITIKT